MEQAPKKILEEQKISHALGTRLLGVLAENKVLKAQVGRDSSNSSIPPSADPHKKIHNSREKTGKSCGGQPGHTGHARKRLAPDETVELPQLNCCPNRGGEVLPTHKQKNRQVIDLIITTYAKDYISQEHVCPDCGSKHYAPFPEGVENDVNYTSNVKAVPTYLVNYCNMSIDHARGFLYEASRHLLNISKGGTHNFIADFSKKAEDAIEDISNTISASPVIGSDATHVRTNGKQTFIYTFVSPHAVMFSPSESKGRAPLEDSLLAGYKGIVIHDHDISFYHYGTGHGECNVHILRYLKSVCENEPEKLWAELMYNLLICANTEAKAAREEELAALSQEVIDGFYARYDAIIELAKSEYAKDGPYLPKYKPEGINLFTRLDNYEDNHLLFLKNLDVPFSNNSSEQALRAAKQKMKQSGGFRSTKNGAAHYCNVLTVTKTAAMRGMETLGVIRDIFDGKTDIFKTSIDGAKSADP